MQFKVAYDLKLRKNESFLEIYKGRWTFIGTAYEFKSLFFKSSGVVESTDLLTLKRRCAEPSCFSGFADLTDGSITDRRVEVIVLPDEEQKVSENLKKSSNIEFLVDSLVGVIRDTGMTLEDYRAERLGKYESLD